MNILGNVFATLFSGHKDHYEKISDYIDLENSIQPYVFFNSNSSLITVMDIKVKINKSLQVLFCLEFDKLFTQFIESQGHIQFFKAKQGNVLKDYIVIYSKFNSEKHIETCKEISNLITKYKGETSYVRNDHFKKYLKFFADTSINNVELKKEEDVKELLDRKNYDIHVNYLKVGSHYYSVLSLAFDTRFTDLDTICNELEDVDYHISLRIEKPITPKTTIDTVIHTLSDEQLNLSTSAVASTFQIKIWSKSLNGLYKNIHKVSRAFNYHGKTLYINNDDQFFDFISAIPALKQDLHGEIKIDSLNSIVFNCNLFE